VRRGGFWRDAPGFLATLHRRVADGGNTIAGHLAALPATDVNWADDLAITYRRRHLSLRREMTEACIGRED